MKKILNTFFILVISHTYADFSLDDLNKADLDNLSKEYSANFMHTSVSGASSLGEIFGFEIGLVGGVTDSPKLNELIKETDPSEDNEQLPHAGILGMVSVPFGITGELSFIPSQSSDNFEFQTTSLALKWNFSEYLPIPLIDIAARMHYSTSEFKYTDRVDSVDTTVTLDQSVFGAHLVASASLVLVEPYAGIGFARGSTDLGTSGNVTIFDTTFTSSTSQSTSVTSAHLFAGVQLNLLFVKLGGEYSRAFGTNRYTGKLSFYF